MKSGAGQSVKRPPCPRLTKDELRFLLNETEASLACGAEDVMFQQCADKLRAILAHKNGWDK